MSDPFNPEQSQLPFETPLFHQSLSVLDLFAGLGGLSLGFSNMGFEVTGVDREPTAEGVFQTNQIGAFVRKDLATDMQLSNPAVVVGGPPCRPWSAVNMQRRGAAHGDYELLDRFLQHLLEIRPSVFLMENVPPLISDPQYEIFQRQMRWAGYSIASAPVRYSDFGAATARRRLFTVGFRDSITWSAEEFFRRLNLRRRPAQTVRESIEWLRDEPRGSIPDHDWSELRTIEKYRDRYESGRFGWRQLGWDQPAPSFGSVSKTYILHPSAGEGGFPLRVLSVREVLSLMGFERGFRFPQDTARSKRYLMIANAVSPVIARECARTIREMLTGEIARSPESR